MYKIILMYFLLFADWLDSKQFYVIFFTFFMWNAWFSDMQSSLIQTFNLINNYQK